MIRFRSFVSNPVFGSSSKPATAAATHQQYEETSGKHHGQQQQHQQLLYSDSGLHDSWTFMARLWCQMTLTRGRKLASIQKLVGRSSEGTPHRMHPRMRPLMRPLMLEGYGALQLSWCCRRTDRNEAIGELREFRIFYEVSVWDFIQLTPRRNRNLSLSKPVTKRFVVDWVGTQFTRSYVRLKSDSCNLI